MIYLTDRDVAQIFRVSRSTVWRWSREGRFPRPRKFGPGCARWSQADVDAHAAKSPPATGPIRAV